MSKFPKRLSLIALALLAVGNFALAAEFRSGKDVTVAAEETVKDDLYAAGATITIDGLVEGDLIALAKDIIINGEVRGDVIAAAQSIEAAGILGDDVHVAGEAIKFGPKAKVGGDVIAAGLSLEAEKESVISGDFLYAGYQALLAGQIDKDVLAALSNLQVAGKVRGDAEVFFESVGTPPSLESFSGGQLLRIRMPNVPGGLTIDGTAAVAGKLKYTSNREAKVDDAAKITGGVTHEIPGAAPGAPNQPPAPPTPVELVLSRLRHVLCAGLIGLVVFLLMPKSSLAWADNIRTRPLASLGGGILGFFGFFIVGIGLVIATVAIAIGVGLATLTELLPTVIVGGILGFAILIFVFGLFAAFLAEAVVGLALGRVFLRPNNFAARLGAFLIGLAMVGLALSFPYAGIFLAIVVFLFGLGGYTLWLCGFEPVVDTLPPSSPPRSSRPGVKA